MEYRVEITPTVSGNEDAVLRVLSGSKTYPLGDMGFSQENLEKLKKYSSNLLAFYYALALQGRAKPPLFTQPWVTLIHLSEKYGRLKTLWRSRNQVSDRFRSIPRQGIHFRKPCDLF